MRCLYCGKELALFKRLRGGEFCSDAHRQRYQEEYTQLALNRLLQANSPQEKETGGANPKENKAAEPESPALKRRERMGREEIPATAQAVSTPLASASIAKPVESAVLATPKQADTPKQTAVLDPEPATVAAQIATPVKETPRVEETAPAGMSSFLLEFPVASVVETAAIIESATNLVSTPGPALPRLQELPPEAVDDRLGPAGRIELSLFTLADFQTPPHERGLELRDFVHGVPQAEIRLRPATETGFDPVREPLEMNFASAQPPENAPGLWQFSEEHLPAIVSDVEISLGDLARLDFGVTGWEAAAPGGASEEQRPPANEVPQAANEVLQVANEVLQVANEVSQAANQVPQAIGSAGPEPMRVGPIPIEAAPREGFRPEPLHFEPVHIDPVFMEQIAATAEFNALKTAQVQVNSSNGQEPVELPPSQPELTVETAPETAVVLETVEAEPEAQAPAASEIAAPAQPTPPAVTKPAPVTLHGLAPARGKPVQVFTSAVFRSGDVQVPREACLPLRPTMVLGPAPKVVTAPAAVPPSSHDKIVPSRPVKSIPVPEKRDSRPAELKPNRSEVRILPVRVKEELPARQKDPVRQMEPAKPTPAKEPPAAPLKETAAEKPKASPPVEIRPPAPVPAAAKSRVVPAPIVPPFKEPAPTAPVSVQEEPDLLGLPKLSFQPSENFWTRLPVIARIGAVAACLALVVGGIMLTSRGSGAAKVAPPADREPQMVEAGSALANTAGWAQDWFADRAGSQQGRHVDVLRGSLTLRDYRMVFEGQIEHGALGWVFRANDKSFYVEKIQVVAPGREPVVALVRFAVIDGQEQPRTQIPLAIKAHLDTMYKVRMDVVGSRFTTWVQDEKVDQWTDSQIGAGGVGLYYDSGDSAKLKDTLNVIPLIQR